MIGKKWWSNVRKKYSPFKKNVFNVRDAHGKKRKVEVARVSDHKFFKQRFSVYLRSKERILRKMGLTKKQALRATELSNFAKVGQLSYQGQVMSINSALVVKDFVNKNKEFLIDLYADKKNKRNKTTDKETLKYVQWMIDGIEKAVERKAQPKHDLDYNPGIVDRIDHLLIGEHSHGSTPIIMPRLPLMSLAELEQKYVKSILGSKYDEFVASDKLAAKDAFGEGRELII